MMRGMKKYLLLGVAALFFIFFTVPYSVDAINDPGGSPVGDIYEIDHSLKYTDASKMVITGSIDYPIEPSEYTFNRYRVEDYSESMSGYIVSWYRVGDGAGNHLEIKRNDPNNGAVNHTLYAYLGTRVDTWDIMVSDHLGNEEDTSDGVDPGIVPSPPSGGDSTTPEEAYYGINSGSDQGDLSQPAWHTVFNNEEATSYQDWIKLVWNWAMAIMIPLSVLIFTAAGVIYTVSEGDSKRIEMAKRMIIGVVSGVGLLILSRVFLLVILGEEGAARWFIFF